MKLEQQLTPFPQARRLDELGFKGESLYAYNERSDGDTRLWFTGKHELGLEDAGVKLEKSYKTYSCSELMDALPHKICVNDIYYEVFVSKRNDKYHVYYYIYYYTIEDKTLKIIGNTNLAEALSDMLIRLITEGLYIVNKE